MNRVFTFTIIIPYARPSSNSQKYSIPLSYTHLNVRSSFPSRRSVKRPPPTEAIIHQSTIHIDPFRSGEYSSSSYFPLSTYNCFSQHRSSFPWAGKIEQKNGSSKESQEKNGRKHFQWGNNFTTPAGMWLLLVLSLVEVHRISVGHHRHGNRQQVTAVQRNLISFRDARALDSVYIHGTACACMLCLAASAFKWNQLSCTRE